MTARPHVLLSVAASLDGCIDDTSGTRLVLSSDADLDRVDAVRAEADAILVGANTIRADNPRLLVRSAARQQRRIARGLPGSPIKVTLTGSGALDETARFFTAGEHPKLVYTSDAAAPELRRKLGAVATVVDAGRQPDLERLLADLADRGVSRLLVEGGSSVHTQFLLGDLVDELHLVYAPFLLGDPEAPRFVTPAAFPQGPERRMTLLEARQLGDVVLLRYQPRKPARTDEEDRRHLAHAIELAGRCPPAATAFSVGAVIADASGEVLATGHSREHDPHEHAEEAALGKLASDDPRLAGATLYSSLEPCSSRASRPLSCTELILRTSIPRIVFAWREPVLFVDCDGAERLRQAGRETVELPDLANSAREPNAHLL